MQGFTVDELRHLTNNDITRELVQMNAGKIKKKDQPQPVEQGSIIPGKNKYVVLEQVTDRSKNLPYFTFFDDYSGRNRRMYLNYRGKPRWCKLC